MVPISPSSNPTSTIGNSLFIEFFFYFKYIKIQILPIDMGIPEGTVEFDCWVLFYS